MKISAFGLAALGLAVLCGCSDTAPPAEPGLPTLGAAPAVTVSGISAGAYMAGQFHVAFANSVDGAGLVAGGPWGCASGELDRALGACISGTGLDVEELVANLRDLAAQDAIDGPAGLVADRVFLFHGALDTIVAAAVTEAAADWYRKAAPDSELAVVTDVPAVHGWPTVDSGARCDELREPFVNACDYDTAGAILMHLYGELAEPAAVAADLERFSQRPYVAASEASSMADEGLLFVPPQCRGERRCRVHVFFHGCRQAESQVGSVLAEQSGFLRHAESNDLVVLFPQAAASTIAPMNPLACWDWWGYGGSDYLTRDAPQLAAIRAMVERLQQPL